MDWRRPSARPRHRCDGLGIGCDTPPRHVCRLVAERLADLGVGAPWLACPRVEPDALSLELGNRTLGAQRRECLGGQLHITDTGGRLGPLDHASDLIELYSDNGSLPIYVAPLQRLQLAWAQARLKPELEHGLFIGAAGFEDGLALSRAERRHHIVAGLCRLPNELG